MPPHRAIHEFSAQIEICSFQGWLQMLSQLPCPIFTGLDLTRRLFASIRVQPSMGRSDIGATVLRGAADSRTTLGLPRFDGPP
jgi:hypothetical protein